MKCWKINSCCRGMGLVELLVSTALGALLLVALNAVVASFSDIYKTNRSKTANVTQADFAMHRIQNLLSYPVVMDSLSSDSQAFIRIRLLTPRNAIEKLDRDGDGVPDTAILILFDSANNNLVECIPKDLENTCQTGQHILVENLTEFMVSRVPINDHDGRRGVLLKMKLTIGGNISRVVYTRLRNFEA